jgi:hypothetical protein
MESKNLTSISISFKSKKDIATLLFASLWIMVCIYKADIVSEVSQINSSNLFFLALGLFVTLFFAYKIFWILTGKVNLYIDNNTVVEKKYILGIPISSYYPLKEIRNLRITKTEKADTYWGIPGFRFHDMERGFLSFEYEKRSPSIGKDLDDFDAKLVFEEIKKRL